MGSETNENLEKKYKEYLAKYGEENAQYLMEIEEGWMKHYSYAASVDFELFRFLNYHGKVKDIAQKKSLQYREIAGDLNLLKKLLNGDWNHHEFLILQPGQKVEVTNDESVIVGVDIQISKAVLFKISNFNFIDFNYISEYLKEGYHVLFKKFSVLDVWIFGITLFSIGYTSKCR